MLSPGLDWISGALGNLLMASGTFWPAVNLSSDIIKSGKEVMELSESTHQSPIDCMLSPHRPKTRIQAACPSHSARHKMPLCGLCLILVCKLILILSLHAEM